MFEYQLVKSIQDSVKAFQVGVDLGLSLVEKFIEGSKLKVGPTHGYSASNISSAVHSWRKAPALTATVNSNNTETFKNSENSDTLQKISGFSRG